MLFSLFVKPDIREYILISESLSLVGTKCQFSLKRIINKIYRCLTVIQLIKHQDKTTVFFSDAW